MKIFGTYQEQLNWLNENHFLLVNVSEKFNVGRLLERTLFKRMRYVQPMTHIMVDIQKPTIMGSFITLLILPVILLDHKEPMNPSFNFKDIMTGSIFGLTWVPISENEVLEIMEQNDKPEYLI